MPIMMGKINEANPDHSINDAVHRACLGPKVMKLDDAEYSRGVTCEYTTNSNVPASERFNVKPRILPYHKDSYPLQQMRSEGSLRLQPSVSGGSDTPMDIHG